jgi:hypothetical protein
MHNSANPLSRHFRQPKLYIKLPSNGNFYPDGAIDRTTNNEYPVYSMTAKDELRFKTPDALLNGQATVDVVQSCIPNIRDAWSIPSIDVDAILIAIRIATYGEKMDITTTLPNTEIEKTFEVDLRHLLDNLAIAEYDNVIKIGDFTIEIAPLNYRSFTETAMKTFEERRLFRTINDSDLSEEEKISRFNESFNRITEMNIRIVTRSVVSVRYKSEAPVFDPDYINEFFDNIDKDVFKAIIKHVEAQRDRFRIPPLEATTTEEEQAAGAPDKFSIPVNFDQSNFFA